MCRSALTVSVACLALQCCTAAFAEKPAEKAARLREAGVLLGKAERFDEAIATFDRALQLVADSLVYVRRAQCWYELSQYDKAIADCNSAIELDPRLALAYVTRGFSRWETKDANRAIADFTLGIDLDDSNFAPFMGRAAVWMKLEQWQLALPDLDEALRREKDHAGAYGWRVACLLSLGEWRRTIVDCGRLIDLDPTSHAAHVMRGKAFESIKEFARARDDYDQATKLKPKDASSKNALAMILVACPDTSVRNYTRGIEIATDNCRATGWRDWRHLAMLATAHAQSGDFMQARKLQADALRVAPRGMKEQLEARLNLYRAEKPPYPGLP